LDGTIPAETVVCTEADAQNHRIAQGAYRNGERHGKWTRWFQPGEGPMFRRAEYAEFSAPFTIEVELADGVLHGQWVVYDSQKRRACRWEFQHGKPRARWCGGMPTAIRAARPISVADAWRGAARVGCQRAASPPAAVRVRQASRAF